MILETLAFYMRLALFSGKFENLLLWKPGVGFSNPGKGFFQMPVVGILQGFSRRCLHSLNIRHGMMYWQYLIATSIQVEEKRTHHPSQTNWRYGLRLGCGLCLRWCLFGQGPQREEGVRVCLCFPTFAAGLFSTLRVAALHGIIFWAINSS